ncbi:MAG: 50S ribosomal protein L9 [Erysipelotrichaceae bacterium]|nr:50S ribosomal protein L9 [Erysipelotrichaceae bacterium]
MKVILLSDVKKVGKKGEIIDVSDGYARNFLIARGLAVQSTKSSMEVLDKQNQARAEEMEAKKQEAIALAEELKNVKFEFQLNSKNGNTFGSISTKQIVAEMAKQGYTIDKRKIIDTQPISSLGTTIVKVELFKGVIGEIKVHVSEK